MLGTKRDSSQYILCKILYFHTNLPLWVQILCRKFCDIKLVKLGHAFNVALSKFHNFQCLSLSGAEVITSRQRNQVRIIFNFRNIVLFPFNLTDSREITLTGTGEDSSI